MSKTVVVPSSGLGMNGMCNPYGMGFGIPPIGMVGVWGNGGWGGGWGGGRGRDGEGFGGGSAFPAALIGGGRVEGNIERQLEMVSDNMNSRFNDLNGDVRTSRIEGSIGGVKDQIGHVSDRMFTMALSDKDSYYSIDKSILIGQKDIIASQLKCCCEQKEIALDQGCRTRETIHCEAEKTRAMLCCEFDKNRALIERLDRERLITHNVDLKGEVSNLKQTDELKGFVGRQFGEVFEAIGRLNHRVDRMDRE